MNNIRKNIVKTFVITRKNSVNTDSQYPKLGTHHRIFSTSSIVAAVRDFNEVNRSALAFFFCFLMTLSAFLAALGSGQSNYSVNPVATW